MKTIQLSFFLLISVLFANGQTTLNPLESTPYIEVTGEGEMEIIPDEIFISFTLKERYDGKTKIAIESQEKELKQKLLKLNFDLKNLMLANASADYLVVRRKEKDVIASKNFQIKVDKVSDLDKVFTTLDEVNAFDANISRVDHSNIEGFRKDVKILAMKAAKEKASYLLEAVGEQVGRPLYIQERENYQPEMRMLGVANFAKSEDSMSEEVIPEISFKKIKLKYTVFARFAIKQ